VNAVMNFGFRKVLGDSLVAAQPMASLVELRSILLVSY
jgi:hypothetical protein